MRHNTYKLFLIFSSFCCGAKFVFANKDFCKKAISSLSQFAVPENYYSIDHVDFRGMQKPNGQKSLLGKLAFVTYTKNGQTKKYIGRIVDEFQAGMRIADEKTGEVHDININFGEIKSVKVEPKEYFWSRAEGSASKDELFRLINTMKEPLGLVSIQGGNLFGALSVRSIHSGYKAVVLTDAQGTKHILDPDYVDVTNFSIISKIDTPEGMFSSLSRSPSMAVFDTRQAERLNLVDSLIAQKKYYDDPIYYDFFLKDLEYTKTMLTRWYGKEGKSMIERVSKELGEDYIVLLSDPGIANRLDKLLPFGKKFIRKNKGTSPFKLRESFSSQLGKKRIFRGMMLTEQEKVAMEKGGVFAPGFQNIDNVKNSLFDTMNALDKKSRSRHATKPNSEITARLTDLYDADKRMWMSVSGYKEIAESAGYYDSGKIGDESHKLYVFEIEVPEISIIRQEKLFQQESRYGKKVFITVGPKFRTSMTHDLSVEMFIPYRVKSEDIIKVTTYDSPPPQWEREIPGQ